MKQIVQAVTTVFLLAFACSLQAQTACCGWGPGSFDGTMEVGVEALYWKPTGAPFQFASRAIALGNTTTLERLTIVPDYEWGFRAFAGFTTKDCRTFALVDWAHLKTSDASTARDAFVFNEDIAVATGRLKLEYDLVNLRFGRILLSRGNSRFYAYGGGRYLYLSDREFVNASTAAGAPITLRQKSSFQGGGIEVGVGGEYSFCSPISIVAKLGVNGSIGRTKNNFRFLPASEELLVANIRPQTICFPGAQFRIGAKFAYSFCCVSVGAEAGYQMDYYWDALIHLVGTDSESFNIGFAGPYAGLFLRF